MSRKVIRSDEGYQVWRNNQIIAMTDENEVLRARINGEWQTIGKASNEREILAELDAHGIFR